MDVLETGICLDRDEIAPIVVLSRSFASSSSLIRKNHCDVVKRAIRIPGSFSRHAVYRLVYF